MMFNALMKVLAGVDDSDIGSINRVKLLEETLIYRCEPIAVDDKLYQVMEQNIYWSNQTLEGTGSYAVIESWESFEDFREWIQQQGVEGHVWLGQIDMQLHVSHVGYGHFGP